MDHVKQYIMGILAAALVWSGSDRRMR